MKKLNFAPNTEIAAGVKRWDIMKYASYTEARRASYSPTRRISAYVMVDKYDGPKPYWVVSPAIATKLQRAGYEYA